MNENFTITDQGWQPEKPKWELSVWDLSFFDWNKKSHWLCVSVSKLPRDFDFFDDICPKRVLPVENRKSEHRHGILHIQIIFGTKFQFKLKILIFLDYIWPKRVFPIIDRKVNTTIDQICLKRLFPVKNKKSERHRWILHIWISLGTKFQLKQTISSFWTKFAQKGYFWSKTEEMNIIIEFYIFKLD